MPHSNRQRVQAWSQLVAWCLGFVVVNLLLDFVVTQQILTSVWIQHPTLRKAMYHLPPLLFAAFHWFVIWFIPRRHFLTFIDTDVEHYCSNSTASQQLPHEQQQHEQQRSESWWQWRPRSRNSIFVGILICNASFLWSAECCYIFRNDERLNQACYAATDSEAKRRAEAALPTALVPRFEQRSYSLNHFSLFLTDGRHFEIRRGVELCWSSTPPNSNNATFAQLQHCRQDTFIQSDLLGLQCENKKDQTEQGPSAVLSHSPPVCQAICVIESEPATRQRSLLCFSAAGQREGEYVHGLSSSDLLQTELIEPYESDLWLRTVDWSRMEHPTQLFRITVLPDGDNDLGPLWKAERVAVFEEHPGVTTCLARKRQLVAAGSLGVAAVWAGMGWGVNAVAAALGARTVLETWLVLVAGSSALTLFSNVLAPVAISCSLVADLFPARRHVMAWILYSLSVRNVYSAWSTTVAIFTCIVLQFPVLDLIGWVGVPVVVLLFIFSQDISVPVIGLCVCCGAFATGNYLERNPACHERIHRLRIALRRQFRLSP